MARVRAVCKVDGWQYRLWYEESGVLRSDTGDAIDYGIYQHFSPECSNLSVKADLARYVILSARGGLYLDADVDLRSLPENLRGAWVMVCRDYGPVNCAVMAAPPGHAYFERKFEIVRKNPERLHHRYAGMGISQEALGTDVHKWACIAWFDYVRPHWGTIPAIYGNHLYRAPGWGSQKPIR